MERWICQWSLTYFSPTCRTGPNVQSGHGYVQMAGLCPNSCPFAPRFEGISAYSRTAQGLPTSKWSIPFWQFLPKWHIWPFQAFFVILNSWSILVTLAILAIFTKMPFLTFSGFPGYFGNFGMWNILATSRWLVYAQTHTLLPLDLRVFPPILERLRGYLQVSAKEGRIPK